MTDPGRERQIELLAGLLVKLPKPFRAAFAADLYDGGARVSAKKASKVSAPKSDKSVKPARQLVSDVESPMRAMLRSQNPELFERIEAAQAAKAAGDAQAFIELSAELAPKAEAEAKRLQAVLESQQ